MWACWLGRGDTGAKSGDAWNRGGVRGKDIKKKRPGSDGKRKNEGVR